MRACACGCACADLCKRLCRRSYMCPVHRCLCMPIALAFSACVCTCEREQDLSDTQLSRLTVICGALSFFKGRPAKPRARRNDQRRLGRLLYLPQLPGRARRSTEVKTRPAERRWALHLDFWCAAELVVRHHTSLIPTAPLSPRCGAAEPQTKTARSLSWESTQKKN